jgi:hypothetical protein
VILGFVSICNSAVSIIKPNSIIKLIKKSIMQYTNNNQYPYMYSDGSEEEGDSDG